MFCAFVTFKPFLLCYIIYLLLKLLRSRLYLSLTIHIYNPNLIYLDKTTIKWSLQPHHLVILYSTTKNINDF